MSSLGRTATSLAPPSLLSADSRPVIATGEAAPITAGGRVSVTGTLPGPTIRATRLSV